MRPFLLLLTLALVALQVAGQDPAGGAAEVPQPAVDGAVNTRAGPQSAAAGGAAAGGQDLRFSPAFLGSVLQAGSALINSALTGGAGGHQHHHGGDFGHGGHQPGFNQFGHGGFGASNFGGGGFRGRRPHRPGGFGGRPNRPGFGHQGGFGHHGHQNFGGHQGGFGHQGNFGHQGGFGQGGFGQGGFGQQGGFSQGNFGDEKGGSCPPVRAECPLRSFGPPNPCVSDFACPAADKCCFDVCLKERVCKPPQ